MPKMTRYQERATAWDSKFEELQYYKVMNGNVNVHHTDRPLYTWVLSQRRRHREGRLEPDRVMRLKVFGGSSYLDGNIGGAKSIPTTNIINLAHEYDDESDLASHPPPELNSAAACLLLMSRTSPGEKDLIEDNKEEKEEPAIQLNFKKLNSITFPYCVACRDKLEIHTHHIMCPKNKSCNHEKLEKLVRGYNAGCANCQREFEFGSQTGRHEAHSNVCPRSTKYKAPSKKRSSKHRPVAIPALVTPKTVIVTTRKAKKMKPALPNSILLPDMLTMDFLAPPPLLYQKSVEIKPLPHEISPLITVDTFDLDGLITDLENGRSSNTETLERLQMIRRTAF